MCVSARVTCHVEVSICQQEKVYPHQTLRLPDCVKERVRPLLPDRHIAYTVDIKRHEWPLANLMARAGPCR